VPVHDLAVHPKEGDLVLGTHGRSVFVAEAAPLRDLTPEVAKEPLHAFKVKSATWERRRGYGENEFYAFYRIPVTRSIAWWAGAAGAGTATLTVKDAKGRVWKEWTAPSAAGFNAVDYDLSADPARADANEEALRKEAAEAAAKARKPGGGEAAKEADAAKAAPEAGEDDEAGEAGSKATPPEVSDLLADPLRKARPRYLPAGRYTVEIAVGSVKASTRLAVKAPKKETVEPEED
jgi:hypothetical protein